MICKENQKFCITKMFKDGDVERYCDGFRSSQQFCMSPGTWRVENGEMFCCTTDYCNTNTTTLMTKANLNSSPESVISALLVLVVSVFGVFA
ncbi:hypothetical protein L596_016233 [Steinernema carpocapsae]|nr:hypothetical protein L596_016233 [Steinernema carpocapsae]